MANKCRAPGCDNPVFNNKYKFCKYHLWMSEEYRNRRLKQKEEQIRRSKPLNRKKGYKIPPMSEKHKEEIKNYSQKDLFKEIWAELPRPIKCPVSNQRIGFMENTDSWHWCFAHVLPKGKYPELKLLKDNIIVVHPDVHTLYDQGVQKQRDKHENWNWDILYRKREELLKKYGK